MTTTKTNNDKANMKHTNKSFGNIAAIIGLYFNRSNWFYMMCVPAISGQKYCVAVMVGTHGRYGLLIGNRWIFNGNKTEAI